MNNEIFLGSLKISQENILDYCKASGDFNPIHFDKKSADALGLENTIAHGMYLVGIMYRFLSEYFRKNNRKIRIDSLSTKFFSPVPVGKTVALSMVPNIEADDQNNAKPTLVYLYFSENRDEGLCCQGSFKVSF